MICLDGKVKIMPIALDPLNTYTTANLSTSHLRLTFSHHRSYLQLASPTTWLNKFDTYYMWHPFLLAACFFILSIRTHLSTNHLPNYSPSPTTLSSTSNYSDYAADSLVPAFGHISRLTSI